MIPLLILVLAAADRRLHAAEPAPPKNTQAETIALTPPQQAAASFAAPEGFSVSLFASEPDVRQPIAITTDARGRLWVAENNTYAERTLNFDLSQRDRIVILEDTDHDGRADRRKVFWDQGTRLTSVEVGFGGVWALCPPQLLFLPDRNGDDVPDGEPEVVLDGWDIDAVRHNIANGLQLGARRLALRPARHPGHVARRAAGHAQRPADRAQLLHLALPSHPQGLRGRLPGDDQLLGHGLGRARRAVLHQHRHRPPLARRARGPLTSGCTARTSTLTSTRLMSQTADHFHWDTDEKWDVIRKVVSPTTDQAGGGHAHSGLMIYQGDNWPERYRDTVLTDQPARPPAQQRPPRAPGCRLRRPPRRRPAQDLRPLVSRPRPDRRVRRRRLPRRLVRHRRVPRERRRPPLVGPDLQGHLRPAAAARRSPTSPRSTTRSWSASRPTATNGTSARPGACSRSARSRDGRWARSTRRCGRHVRARARRAATSSARSGPCTSPAGHRQPWLLEQLDHEDEHVRVWAVRLLVDDRAPAEAAVRAVRGTGRRRTLGPGAPVPGLGAAEAPAGRPLGAGRGPGARRPSSPTTRSCRS